MSDCFAWMYFYVFNTHACDVRCLYIYTLYIRLYYMFFFCICVWRHALTSNTITVLFKRCAMFSPSWILMWIEIHAFSVTAQPSLEQCAFSSVSRFVISVSVKAIQFVLDRYQRHAHIFFVHPSSLAISINILIFCFHLYFGYRQF